MQERVRLTFDDVPSVLRTEVIARGGMNLRRPLEFSLQMADSELLVEIPADFELLLRADADLAVQWRSTTRSILTAYFARGYVIDDFWPPRAEDSAPCFYHLIRRD